MLSTWEQRGGQRAESGARNRLKGSTSYVKMIVSLLDVLTGVCVSDAVVAGFAHKGVYLHRVVKTRHGGEMVAGN